MSAPSTARSAELHARGRAAWPSVDVPADELLVAVDGCSQSAGLADDAIDVGELYVSCGCQHGDAVALAAFRAAYFAPLVRRLGSMGLDGAGVDDLWQVLSMRLFLGVDGEPARITGYAGRGQLHGLVNASIRAAGHPASDTPCALDPDGRPAVLTAGDGSFVLPALPEGRYELVASDPGGATASVETTSASTEDVTLIVK